MRAEPAGLAHAGLHELACAVRGRPGRHPAALAVDLEREGDAGRVESAQGTARRHVRSGTGIEHRLRIHHPFLREGEVGATTGCTDNAGEEAQHEGPRGGVLDHWRPTQEALAGATTRAAPPPRIYV